MKMLRRASGKHSGVRTIFTDGHRLITGYCSMKKEQVVNCQFSVWYPIFKKHTIKRSISANMLRGCVSQGSDVTRLDHNTQQTQTNNNDSDAEEDIQWSDDETTTTVTAPEFPEFTSKVLEAINSLGGRIFPKLNWSAPRDANWIALNSSLQCDSLSDIFLLFKSSDFITHDLTQPFRQCSDQDSPDPVINYELVLRKWSELIPGGEFRCFVKENKLIAICQRDYTQYYQHVFKQEEQTCQAIQEFFSQHIQYNFLDEDFVFDIYRDSQGRVWLIDLNPFGEVTDSLLFSWEELTSGEVANQQVDHHQTSFTTTDVFL
ncbi:hypothetical protein F2P81_018566 [Scophthalmus maximus]|uniref:Translation initiation factor eIF2 assembly protein n=1 Tax=Scophthalmus maximus TaxID=52904 RepID=A0A6A4SE97_SCOMX|nr:hypothetical protein F2P81_018566 [Scophthalmus maximus]